MSCIYMVKNNINNKIYIGKTVNDYQTRWEQHIHASFYQFNTKDYNFLLHKAIRKYGKANFIVELIEDNLSENDSISREQYWINFYKSSILFEDGKGYNMTYGGEGSVTIDREKVFELWNNGLGSIEISKQLKHDKTAIKTILLLYPGYDKEIDFVRNNGVRVYQYNSNGELIKEYPSITYAARIFNVDPSIINKCCNKEKQSCRGFFWSYVNDEIFIPKVLKTWQQYKVIQKNLDGMIINIFESMSAAGKSVNKKQTKYIKECCDGKRTQMYNYIWEYGEDY